MHKSTDKPKSVEISPRALGHGPMRLLKYLCHLKIVHHSLMQLIRTCIKKIRV